MHAEKIGDLADGQHDGGPDHKAQNDGFRDIARQIAEPENSDENLDGSDHNAQKEQGFHRFDAVVRIKKGQDAEDHERNGAGRSGNQMRRGAEDGGDRGKHDGGIEPEPRVDTGNNRVSHALRQGNCGDGQPGD